jgi:hypothetical protein
VVLLVARERENKTGKDVNMLSKGSMTRAGFVSVPISKPPMMMMISVNSSSSMSQTIQRGSKECFTFAIEIIKTKEGLWGATHRNEFLLL